ncbi:unnamed protein product [Leptidea sinapis]|uniref:Uncharacterized protein n=1 Tax=Leptidea sinapis TaxID=189913 RepID=A0A5E4QM23_9NEOP|nr:unnamed protein product [Leptidea sinapis]
MEYVAVSWQSHLVKDFLWLSFVSN